MLLSEFCRMFQGLGYAVLTRFRRTRTYVAFRGFGEPCCSFVARSELQVVETLKRGGIGFLFKDSLRGVRTGYKLQLAPSPPRRFVQGFLRQW